MAQGSMRPVVDRTFSFDQMRDVHAYLENNGHFWEGRRESLTDFAHRECIIKSILTKLNATDRTGAVMIAASRGYIDIA
jgi:hypothetical protein